jgi:hypothetical protein
MDEDQIEATIRRVAEAKAAREGGAPAPEAAAAAPLPQPWLASEQPRYERESADGPTHSADKAAIEDTIRRVQTARTGMAHNAPAMEPAAGRPAAEESAIEAAIRRVAEAKALRERDEMTEEAEAPAAPTGHPVVEESAIEAAIRRVAEAKALREREETPETPVAATEPAAPAPVRPTLLRPAPTPWQTPHVEAVAGESELAQSVAQLRQELDETKHALDALTARFDAIQTPGTATEETVANTGGEWYDPPALPKAAPAFVHDAAPQGGGNERPATHEERERVIDTRPIPKPLPPLHAEPKRGLDLLPRTYRITVEDKRRGVDLVPLHRALLGMDGVRDMSLLSYSNGVAIVSLEVLHELNPETLGRAVARAMSRETKVEVHNEQTMVVKLAEE